MVEKKLSLLAQKIQMIVFDFDGVFTDNRVVVFQDGKEAVFCWRGDGIGLEMVRKLNINLLVISAETNPVVSARCKKLKIPYVDGCQDKLKVLEEKAKEANISLEEVAYLGNDINDLECLKKVGLPACVADAHPSLFGVAKYITKSLGGKGAVREFCEFIVKAKSGQLSS